jgi:hypothetical protein
MFQFADSFLGRAGAFFGLGAGGIGRVGGFPGHGGGLC